MEGVLPGWTDLLQVLAQPWAPEWALMVGSDLAITDEVTTFARSELRRLFEDPNVLPLNRNEEPSAAEVIEDAKEALGTETTRALALAVQKFDSDASGVLVANAWLIGCEWFLTAPPEELLDFSAGEVRKIRHVIANVEVQAALERAATWETSSVDPWPGSDPTFRLGGIGAAHHSLVLSVSRKLQNSLRGQLETGVLLRLGAWVMARAKEMGIGPSED